MTNFPINTGSDFAKVISQIAVPVKWDALFTAFKEFQTSAFRLETLEAYLVPEEASYRNPFFTGCPNPPAAPVENWKQMIGKATKEGKTFQVVRLLPSVINPYLRYEIEWCYSVLEEFGQRTRLVLPGGSQSVFQRGMGVDYWLFDSKLVYFIDYTERGEVKSLFEVKSGNPLLERFLKLQTDAIEASISLQEFLKLYRQAPIKLDVS